MGAERSMPLPAGAMSADAWAPFGWLPVDDTDPRDATYTYEFQWADAHVNVISHAFDEVEHTGRGPVCRWFYRHATHTQVLMPLNVEAVLAVAPPDVDFSDSADVELARAFRVRPLESLALHRGTWHWGPFPLGAEPVRLFNVQGKRYAEDNTRVDLFERVGVSFEVLP
ncbi:MAG: hypothetical protein FJW88_14225 [Actinobacteria bacterium]|nr:hypothetical protein [Actinomycetota bacterium]